MHGPIIKAKIYLFYMKMHGNIIEIKYNNIGQIVFCMWQTNISYNAITLGHFIIFILK